MKKYFLIFSLFFCLLVISGCGKKMFLYNVENSLSERVDTFFVAQNKDFTITLQSGVREKNYILDGIHNENIDFCLITLISNINLDDINEKSFTLHINNKSYSGIFEINPYNDYLIYDLGININAEDLVKVDIKLGQLYENITLENKKWNISLNDALSIASTTIYNDVKKSIKNNFTMETYLKILYDPTNLSNPYYWYVGFCHQNKSYLYVVIDVNTGNIVTYEQKNTI